MKRILTAMALLLGFLGAVLLPVGSAGAAAGECAGTFTLGVGGLTAGPQTSAYFNAQQPVGYNGLDSNDGLRELGRLFWLHRNACPGDHIKIIGHSQGAGIVHQFTQQNPNPGNVNAVLVADPKRAPGPGNGGMMQIIPFHPLSGIDGDFGGWPTLTICNHDDGVCNLEGGSFVGNPSHGNYDMNVWAYGNWDNGVWFR